MKTGQKFLSTWLNVLRPRPTEELAGLCVYQSFFSFSKPNQTSLIAFTYRNRMGLWWDGVHIKVQNITRLLMLNFLCSVVILCCCVGTRQLNFNINVGSLWCGCWEWSEIKPYIFAVTKSNIMLLLLHRIALLLLMLRTYEYKLLLQAVRFDLCVTI